MEKLALEQGQKRLLRGSSTRTLNIGIRLPNGDESEIDPENLVIMEITPTDIKFKILFSNPGTISLSD